MKTTLFVVGLLFLSTGVAFAQTKPRALTGGNFGPAAALKPIVSTRTTAPVLKPGEVREIGELAPYEWSPEPEAASAVDANGAPLNPNGWTGTYSVLSTGVYDGSHFVHRHSEGHVNTAVAPAPAPAPHYSAPIRSTASGIGRKPLS